jgi:hypothetical protein
MTYDPEWDATLGYFPHELRALAQAEATAAKESREIAGRYLKQDIPKLTRRIAARARKRTDINLQIDVDRRSANHLRVLANKAIRDAFAADRKAATFERRAKSAPPR